MTLSLIIKKKYLDEKLMEQEKNGTFYERREYNRFWRKRIGSTSAWNLGGDAVFLCGRYAFRAKVCGIKIGTTPDEYVDVAGKTCYMIECKFEEYEINGLCVFLSS